MPKKEESKRYTVTKEKPKCSFRIPDAEQLFEKPYERWVIYCDCGCTIFGNTIDEVQTSWYRHIEGAF